MVGRLNILNMRIFAFLVLFVTAGCVTDTSQRAVQQIQSIRIDFTEANLLFLDPSFAQSYETLVKRTPFQLTFLVNGKSKGGTNLWCEITPNGFIPRFVERVFLDTDLPESSSWDELLNNLGRPIYYEGPTFDDVYLAEWRFLSVRNGIWRASQVKAGVSMRTKQIRFLSVSRAGATVDTRR